MSSSLMSIQVGITGTPGACIHPTKVIGLAAHYRITQVREVFPVVAVQKNKFSTKRMSMIEMKEATIQSNNTQFE